MDRQPKNPKTGKPECPDYPDYPGRQDLSGLPAHKKMPGPSVFKTRGARASKGGGDLLSRIALQYHRRWRA